MKKAAFGQSFFYGIIPKFYAASRRDAILVEKEKHHKNRLAVGMPPKYIMLHTYGMLWVLELIILDRKSVV
jgi:hypothetical protein